MDSRIQRAKDIICREAEVVRGVADRLDSEFTQVVDMLLELEGRVVTAGMGKAGIIAQKISATFSSTGTPSIYLHPAEAIHGDLGRVVPKDVLMAFSKSGETAEVLALMAPVKAVSVPVVAVTETRNSTLGRHADVVLELGPIEEVGPYQLAPSASTTAMLALGDALALVVQEGRNFGPQEFARFHPGGNLGRRFMRVEELMRKGSRNPAVHAGATVIEAIATMTKTPGRPGATSIVGDNGQLLGFFTDGDLRRLLENGNESVRDMHIEQVMTVNPKTILPETFALEAVAILHQYRVDQLPVVTQGGDLVGLLDVQDLLDLKID